MTDTALFKDETDLLHKVRTRDSHNSWNVAPISRPAQANVKDRIVNILVDGPMTDEDIYDLYVIGGGERTAQRVRTARKELERDGIVRRHSEGKSRVGNASDKWCLA